MPPPPPEVAAPLFDRKGIVTQCKRFFGDVLVTETVKRHLAAGDGENSK